jgi:disulfide bond formation protein DsbB
MRLMIMVLILIGVVVGMMQCATKTMHKKKPHLQEDGRAPIPGIYLADVAKVADQAHWVALVRRDP